MPLIFVFANESVIVMAKIARLILASGENCADMRYAAGFSTPDEFFYYETQSVRGVIVSPLEFSRAVREAHPDAEVRAESEFGQNRIEIVKALGAMLRVGGFLVPQDFPLLWADRIREAGFSVKPQPGTFFPEREFKSEEEIGKITASQRAGEAGFMRAVMVLSEAGIGKDNMLFWRGEVLTSEILRAEIDLTMVRCGMLPTGTICAGGAQGAQPHNTGSGALYANSPIVMDIFPRSASTGYWGDLTRTVVKGRASALVKKAYETVLAARELGKSMVKAGAVPSEIHRAVAHSMEKAGFRTGKTGDSDFGFFHGLGHGVGLDIHEAPRLSPRNDVPLRGGEAVTVEPGLYYPEWGGIRLEDLVVVTAGGARCLTDAPDFLEIP